MKQFFLYETVLPACVKLTQQAEFDFYMAVNFKQYSYMG